jgi:hypothetical protein
MVLCHVYGVRETISIASWAGATVAVGGCAGKPWMRTHFLL